MKKRIIFVVLLFLLVGIVSAADDSNATAAVGDTQQDIISVNETTANTQEPPKETPTVTASPVSGKAGKTIALTASVRNSQGPLKDVKVTFTLNGKTYSATTDANGVAVVKVKCPASAALKTTQKKKGKILTKTTKYSKTYKCTVSVDGASSSFKVTSKKNPVTKKYKMTKKDKVATIPIKSGSKTYKKGSYGIATYKLTNKGINYLKVGMIGEIEGGLIKFLIKKHVKMNGKSEWDSWYKVRKGEVYSFIYLKNVKVDKVKIKYSKISLKRIK